MTPPDRFLASLSSLGAHHAPVADWLRSVTSFISPHQLVAAKLPGFGVGLVAAERVAAGDVVLRVPHSVWSPVSAATAVATARRRAPALLARADAAAASLGGAPSSASALPAHVALSLSLLFDDHPFWGSLPSPPDVPSLWPDSVRAALLAGTRVLPRAAARAALVDALHAALFGPPVESGGASRGAPPSQPPPPVGVSKHALAAALATIASRALSGPECPYTFVPCLDLLNHAEAPSCEHSFDTPSEAFVVTALRDHSPGEQARAGLIYQTRPRLFFHSKFFSLPIFCFIFQVFIKYGQSACNDTLLRLYGFVTDPNPHDSFLLPPPWPAPRADDPLRATKLLLLRDKDAGSSIDGATLSHPPPMGGDGGGGGEGGGGSGVGECFWWSRDRDGAHIPARGGCDAPPLLAALRVMHLEVTDLGKVSGVDDATGQARLPPFDGGTAPAGPRVEAAARGSLLAALAAAEEVARGAVLGAEFAQDEVAPPSEEEAAADATAEEEAEGIDARDAREAAARLRRVHAARSKAAAAVRGGETRARESLRAAVEATA